MAATAALSASSGHARDDGADGHYQRRSSSHFDLLQDVDIDRRHGPRGSRQFESDVLAVLEKAYDRMDAWLGLRPRRRIQVIVDDPVVFDQSFARLFKFPAAGFYGGAIRVRGDTQVHASLVRTLHHELVHAGFDEALPHAVLPAWLNEGVAEWFEARAAGRRELSRGQRAALYQAVQQGRWLSLAQLSTPSLGHLTPDAAGLAYLQSFAFIDFLARRSGERSLEVLCSELVRTGSLARALRRAQREDLGSLERAFAAEYGLR